MWIIKNKEVKSRSLDFYKRLSDAIILYIQ